MINGGKEKDVVSHKIGKRHGDLKKVPMIEKSPLRRKEIFDLPMSGEENGWSEGKRFSAWKRINVRSLDKR